MKKYLLHKLYLIACIIVLSLIVVGCTTEDLAGEDKDDVELGKDPIVGKWNLVTIYLNDEQYDVANVECYKDSFIESDGKTIEFYIIDRLEDGSCKTEVENTKELTIENDFYFLGDEALDFEINGNTLTWRVSAGSTLTFKK